MLQKCCRLKIQTEGEREGSKGKRVRRETERSQCDLVLWNESLLLLLFFWDICLIFGANYYTFNIGICVKLNLIAANDAHCFPPLYTPFPLASLCHKLPGVESNHISQLTKLINCQPCERERVRGGELFCCHKNFPCAALHSRACKLSLLLLP